MHHIVALLSQAFYSVLDASLVEALQIQLSLQKHPGVSLGKFGPNANLNLDVLNLNSLILHGQIHQSGQ